MDDDLDVPAGPRGRRDVGPAPLAVRLDAGPVGGLVVYRTVLPWNGDVGPDEQHPARGWDEFHRVVPEQATEWAALRERFSDDTLVVAGDLDQDLGGRHYYGSRVGRDLLGSALSSAGLTCLTTTDRFVPGDLAHPPIDHVCAGPGRARTLGSRVGGWDATVHAVRLSDHGGVLAEISVVPPAAHLSSAPGAGA